MMIINREELINNYKNYLKTLGKSEETIRSYRNALNRFLNDTQFETIEEITELNQLFMLDYANSLREEIAVSTINKHIKQLSSFYQYLMVNGLAKSNPCFRLPSLNNNNNEYKEKVLSDEQAKSILKATEQFKEYDKKNELRDKTLIFLLLNCGLRIGEVSRVKIKDIDLNNNKLFVRGKGHNGNVSRYTNFNNLTKGLIIQLISKDPTREYLFINYKGDQLSDQTIRKVWYRACEIADVKGFSPHSVRHFLGSSLVAKGVELKKVAQVLGHGSYKTSERYYVKQKESVTDILDVVDIF